MSAPNHPIPTHPTNPEPDQSREVVFAVAPAEAYARAFARAGLTVPDSLAVRLPLPLSDAGDDELHRLLAQLDDREARPHPRRRPPRRSPARGRGGAGALRPAAASRAGVHRRGP
jgi:hypothetical protein